MEDLDGEGSEALPACTTGLDPAPAHAPTSPHAPATVHNTIHCQPTQGKAISSRAFGEPAASSSHPSGTRLDNFFPAFFIQHF